MLNFGSTVVGGGETFLLHLSYVLWWGDPSSVNGQITQKYCTSHQNFEVSCTKALRG